MESDNSQPTNSNLTITNPVQSQLNPTGDSTDLIKGIDDKKRIAQMEHEIFTVCKQLDEKTEKFKESQQSNAVLKDRIGSLEVENMQKAQIIESLTQSRDNLILEKAQHQNDKLVLERRKDELETQISKLTNEKRRNLDDIDIFRKQCESLRTEKIELQAQIDDFRADKASLAYDKEQWSREKEVLLMSKQWYMNEISNREQKINELRVEMIKEKSEMQREITLLNDRQNDLLHLNEQLTKNMENRERELLELQEKFKKVIDENITRMNELEAEIRTRERLTNVYKEAIDESEKVIDELKDSERRLESLLKEKEEVVRNVTGELETLKEAHNKAIKAKEDEIRRLMEENAKSSELLSAGFRLSRPDEDILRLSPAAAAASSLLKSGLTLTGIYAEHCRVVSELDRKNSEFAQLERHVTELIQELDTKAPKFHEQRKAYEQMCEKNECLRLQNELLGMERQKLQSKSDALARELEFTRRELERYQREHNILNIQVQRLLYIAEKGSEALNHSHMNGDSASDEFLFSNIKELQSKNIELAEELERLRDDQEKIIENFHNSEIENLKQAHGRALEELAILKENYSKKDMLLRELSEQRDQYKNLYDQLMLSTRGGMSSNASTASEATQQQQNGGQPQSLGSLQAELLAWKTKAERLEETIAYLNDDRRTHEKILNERIDQQLEQISTMRMTIGKLESDVEFQNKNQQLLAKQIDSYAVDLKRSNDQLGEAKRQLDTFQYKSDSLTNQMLEKQQELSTLRVQNHSLTEQLAICASREQRSQAELEILRRSHSSTERVSSTLQEMEALLKRVQAEKSHSIESQLQSVLVERDNLRQLVDSLNEQHTQLVNGLKNNLGATCNERDKAQAECKSAQNRLAALERVYEQLKKDNEKLQNEMEQIQSTDTNVEACKKEIQKMKNTIAYHEKQLAEYEQKCEELNRAIERKDKQLEDICRLGTDMESSIQFSTLERQRMQSLREQLENDLRTSKDLVEELRNAVAAKEMELLTQAKLLSEANNQIEEVRGKHEQQLLDSEKNLYGAKLQIESLQAENEKLKKELEIAGGKCEELGENNLRLSADLAQEIAKTERQTREMEELAAENEANREKMQRSIDALGQEKLRLEDEMKAFMEREREHEEKRNALYDEIQRLLKQVGFMEQLQSTIASPSPNTSLNMSAMTAATFSPISSQTPRGEQQQHTDRITTIIGYMRSEKQKETELRMNAELELQRIRAQTGMDQQRIFQLDSEVAKLRSEVEVNARVATEKEQLLTRLNALSEIQARYQQLKKSFDELHKQFGELGQRTQELEQQNMKTETEKKNLETRLEAVTKTAEERARQMKLLRERCERAMAMASKYSPEMVNSLQGENEKMKSDLAQKERDLELVQKESERLGEELGKLNKLREEHAKLTEEHTSLNDRFKVANTQLQTVKQLARKLRDEKVALAGDNATIQSQLSSVQEELTQLRETTSAAQLPVPADQAAPVSTLAAGGTQPMVRQLQEQVEKLTRENEELAAKVATLDELESDRNGLRTQMEGMQREIDDAAEKVMRIDMVEKALKNSQQRVQILNAEFKQLQEENGQLRARVQQLEQRLASLQQQQQQGRREEKTGLLPVPESQSQGFTFSDEPSEGAGTSGHDNMESQMFPITEQQQEDLLFESPESPPPQQGGSSPQNEPSIEEAIIDELDRDEGEDTSVPVEADLGEGILDMDEVGNEFANFEELGEQQQQHQEQQFGDEPHQEGGNEEEQQYQEEHKQEEEEEGEAEEYVEEGEEGFGDQMPSEGAGGGIRLGDEEEEDGFEGGDEEEEVEFSDEEGDLMDEEEEGMGEYGEEGEEEEEEGGEAEQGETSLETGEPPRKQMRMQQEKTEQQEEGAKDATSSAEQAGQEGDDDDDIQLL